MKENLKTRREHLKVLPLQKRLQAMENIRKEAFPSFEKYLANKIDSKDFIGDCFLWDATRQGRLYWLNINNQYYGK